MPSFPTGVPMRNAVVFSFVMLLFVLFGVAPVSTQKQSIITVRGKILEDGVVALQAANNGQRYRLLCNDNMPGCSALKNGRYVMVELPKNFGMYDCKDVEVYPESAGSSNGSIDVDKNKKLGEFCLEEE